MHVHVGLLRAVNLGGHNKVPMAELRAVLAGAGLGNPRTLLQSGNVVFGASSPTAELERVLEERLASELGLETEVMVRTAEEWHELVASNPFPEEAEHDPGHLLVMVLKGAPDAASVAALRAAIKGREEVRPGSRHVYITYPDGIGRSKLTTAVIERHLGTRGTGRNWNTVLKLDALVQAR
jgi:uncharacterized protein (DUF1697 family)